MSRPRKKRPETREEVAAECERAAVRCAAAAKALTAGEDFAAGTLLTEAKAFIENAYNANVTLALETAQKSADVFLAQAGGDPHAEKDEKPAEGAEP